MMANLESVPAILDMVELSLASKVPFAKVAELYFQLGRGLRLYWIRDEIEALAVEGRWRAVARSTLRETLLEQHRTLLGNVLANRGKQTPDAALAEWLANAKDGIKRVRRSLQDMQTAGAVDFATLSVALNEVRKLCQQRT